jgi:hypothetical protein
VIFCVYFSATGRVEPFNRALGPFNNTITLSLNFVRSQTIYYLFFTFGAWNCRSSNRVWGKKGFPFGRFQWCWGENFVLEI